MGKTLKELAAAFASRQPQQVDGLTEEAPILGIIPFHEASHGLWNMYEDVTEVQGAGWVAMNAPLPGVEVTSDLRKVDLSCLLAGCVSWMRNILRYMEILLAVVAATGLRGVPCRP